MIYYWENRVGSKPDYGSLVASSDQEAMNKVPQTAICLYKESDTPDGTPFIVVYEQL